MNWRGVVVRTLLAFVGCLWAAGVFAQEIDPSLIVDDRKVGDDPMKRYFLIRHRLDPLVVAPKEYSLLLVLPGGSGSAEFLPFCANVLTKLSVPQNFVVAELVAPVWDPAEALGLVWPGVVYVSSHAKFTSEELVDAVIDDVSRTMPIRPGRVFTLGWSSSGHVLYSSAFNNPKIRGSFIAMSRFPSALIDDASKAKEKRFYFWHSPDDVICPIEEAALAARLLNSKIGASVIFRTYKGGHGWVPYTFYADRIHEALEWFSADDVEAEAIKAKIEAAGRATAVPR